METPSFHTQDDVRDLTALAKEIEQYQRRKKLSTAAVCKKFAGLGSDKTYNKLRRGDVSELDVMAWTQKYQAIMKLIEASTDKADEEEPLYDDLEPAAWLSAAFLDVMNESGDARFVVMLADTGCGKSSARRLLVREFGDRVFWIEATDVWEDNTMAFLGEILDAFGDKNPPRDKSLRLRRVVTELRQRRRCMVIDEGHHLGPHCLNTIKTILNQTPGEVVLLALERLWVKLTKEAYEEARQLTGNRLSAKIQVSLLVSDIEKILARRIVWSGDEETRTATVAAAAKHLYAQAVGNGGNLALAREVCKEVNDMAAGDPVTLELFCIALTQKKSKR